MRDLQHDAGTVSCFTIGSLCTSVAHVLQHFERVIYQFVAFVSVDVDHHAHAASVVLILGIIESLPFQSFFFHAKCRFV